ncbi:MAG: M12 family metallo-peptidase [Bdellovibrionia bacterium]
MIGHRTGFTALTSLRALSFALTLFGVLSCAKHENLSKNCAISADQKGSIMGRVAEFPVQVTADDQFNSQERESISATIREWNEAGKSFGVEQVFQLRFGAIPSGFRSMDPHQCSSDLGGEHDFYVVREQNQSHWTSIGFVDTTPGATIRCYGSSENDLQRQIIYMNPSLLNAGQFDQAFSHEFGHALGLDHSCNMKDGDASYVACKALKGGTDHPYFQAVMYPILKNTASMSISSRIWRASVSSIQERISSVLQTNDKVRGECVIGPTQ